MGGLYIPYRRTPAWPELQAGDTTYLSEGIWLTGPPGSNEAQALLGLDHKINVVVRNDGGQLLESITVQMWVCRPTSNAGPSTVITVPVGTSPAGTPIMRPSFFRATIASLAPGAVGSVEQSWRPSATEFAVENGHVCLAANVFTDAPNASDGIEYPPELDPSQPTLDALHPESDRHHAQHNVAILAAAAGTSPAAPSMAVTNPGRRPTKSIIAILEQRVGRELAPVDILQLLANWRFGLVDAGGMLVEVPTKALMEVPDGLSEAVIVRLNRAFLLEQGLRPALVLRDEEGVPRRGPHPLLVPARRVIRDVALGIDGEEDGRAGVALEPGASATARPTFTLPEHDEPGAVHVVDVTETNGAGNRIGGLRYLVVAIPEADGTDQG